MSQMYIEPTTAGRTRIALWLVGAVLLYAVLYFGIPRYIRTLPACESVLWFKGVVFAFAALSLVVSLCVLYPIRSALRAGQWPLPDSDVLFRRKVVKGWRLWLEIVSRVTFVGLIALTLTMIMPPTMQYLKMATNACNA